MESGQLGVNVCAVDKDQQPLTCKFINSIGAPGRARTCDLLIRSQTLYPTELRVQQIWSLAFGLWLLIFVLCTLD